MAELQPVDVVVTITPLTKEERQECIRELIRGTDYRLSAKTKRR